MSDPEQVRIQWADLALKADLPLAETPSSDVRLPPYNPDLKRQMSLAEDIMHDDREILRALAE